MQKISKATDGRLNISGYVNGHYMKHSGTPKLLNARVNDLDNGLWQLREASLYIDGVVTNNLLISSEIELGDNVNSLNMNYLYADLDVSGMSDWDTDKWGNFNLRAGRFLVPFLSYNAHKSNFQQSLMSQSFTAWLMSPVNNVPLSYKEFGWTDTGVMGIWNRQIDPLNGIVDVRFALISGLQSNSGALDDNTLQLNTQGLSMMNPIVRPRDGLYSNRSDTFDDNNNNIATTLKISYAPANYPIDTGISWYRGAWDNSGKHDINMYGVHFNYIERNWGLKGEYSWAHIEQDAGIIPGNAMPMAMNATTSDYDMNAWYIEGSYIPYRYGPDDARYVRLIGRYDMSDTNDKAMFSPFNRKRATAGVEWEFMHNVRLRYELQRHTLTDWNNAPKAYIDATGKEHIYMNMVSLIAYF